MRASGKWLYAGDERVLLRGVTYGTFSQSRTGSVPEPDRVAADFAQMAQAGVNAVRTYTVPPAWLLDLALDAGLRVMVGLAWEQHVAFLDEPGRPELIEARLREQVRRCVGHPAVLSYAVGNEIPTSIVRWHGAPAIERFLERLCTAVREEDRGRALRAFRPLVARDAEPDQRDESPAASRSSASASISARSSSRASQRSGIAATPHNVPSRLPVIAPVLSLSPP